MKKRIILGVTGASGSAYATALAAELGGRDDIELHVIISDAARQVMKLETGTSTVDITGPAFASYHIGDIAAPPASGSWRHHGMIICPCSMTTLGTIANGTGNNLIHRAADVTLKEKRPLVLVPRETPLNEIHLRNMLRAHRAGATILPACPGFYNSPLSISDLFTQIAARVLDQLDIEHHLAPRWGDASA
ncbi:UbiX family flavin prenyltransferase [Paucidesulfovibrio longus]|uniref:UbiX family flavin prenyltransferase n=1 Tax=Paucidesulfovibrio longus TaxID=889 RepID=UPI0003B6F764|nr:UbiX family flavin prenyltransferase [Paucidesulfovibrio longus]